MSETLSPETWEKTIPGGVWVLTVDHVGNEKPKRLKGPSGFRFRVHPREREAVSAKYAFPEQDPFRNGILKPVSLTPDEVDERVPDHDSEQALNNEDLVALFAKSGMAFHSAVKKLNEVNARRLLDLAGENAEAVTTAQKEFLEKHVAENFLKQTTGHGVD